MYKYFIFSDVHGEYDALIESLDAAGFDSDNENHILLSAGDSFDRGTQNLDVYKFLRRNSALVIMGNHDKMFYDYLTGVSDGYFDTVYNGLWQTLRDFSREEIPNYGQEYFLPHLRYKINEKNLDLQKWLGTMPDGYKIDNYIITHAGFSTNYIKHEGDESWFPNNWTKTPNFIRHYQKYTGHYQFIFGHWHASKLSKQFIGIENKQSHIFEYENFIGLDSLSNITKRVNIFTIETKSEAVPFISRDSLEKIKKM